MKRIIDKILAILAKKILKKYKPKIIGITGSVGKTSAKEAIFNVLKNKFNTRQSYKNYNTEIGVPLTIINTKSAGKNIFKWLKIILKGLKLILITDKNYPKFLVLEMGADRIGDIKYLTDLAPCNVSVITAVGPAHIEYFGTLEKIIQEKQTLVTHLKKDNWAILNADDNLVYGMCDKTKGKVLTYGLGSKAQIRAEEIKYPKDGAGIMCQISDGDAKVSAHFKNILSTTQLGSLLAAIAVAKVYDINISEAVKNLADFQFPKGRLNLIKGIKNSWLIDDTYNSSPQAVKVGLEILSRLEPSSSAGRSKGRRWAVLGDMLELGSLAESAHQEVGEWVKQFKVDMLVVVGEKSTDTVKVAETHGLSKECAICFDTAEEAGKFVQKEMSQGDVLLIKGSQSMRMEKITKEIMAEPNKAEKLLVRQEKEWSNK